jgi:hypothetical protein
LIYLKLPPFVISIFKFSGSWHFCGASIISNVSFSIKISDQIIRKYKRLFYTEMANNGCSLRLLSNAPRNERRYRNFFYPTNEHSTKRHQLRCFPNHKPPKIHSEWFNLWVCIAIRHPKTLFFINSFSVSP